MPPVKSKLRFSIDDLTEQSIVVNRRLKIIEANKQALEFFGKSEYAFKKNPVGDLFENGFSVSLPEVIKEIKTGESRQFESLIKKGKKKQRVKVQLRNFNENDLFLITISQIHAHKKSEKEKNGESNYYKNIIESSDDAIIGNSALRKGRYSAVR